jgi:hypothetical protein
LLGTAAIAAAALGAVSRPAAAQSGAVQGRVADSSGAVIVGAMFTIDGSGIRTTSTARGRDTVGGIPVGRRVISVRALGFTPETVVVNVTAGTMLDAT